MKVDGLVLKIDYVSMSPPEIVLDVFCTDPSSYFKTEKIGVGDHVSFMISGPNFPDTGKNVTICTDYKQPLGELVVLEKGTGNQYRAQGRILL